MMKVRKILDTTCGSLTKAGLTILPHVKRLGWFYMSSNKNLSYVPGIDGLRAISVVSVMIYHLKANYLRGGFVGVDVFFVISGFVVTLSICNHRFATMRELVVYFYARRLGRIVPALILMLVVSTAITIAIVPNAWLSGSNRATAFYAFFGLSNVRLAQIADDYFGPRTDYNPFAHTWSLGVEEQFYLVFPILIAATVLVTWPKKNNAISIWLTLIASSASLAACIVLTAKNPVFSFFQIPSRFWELGTGVVLALNIGYSSEKLRFLTGVSRVAIGLFAIVVLAISFLSADESKFPFPWAVPPVLAAGVLLCLLSSGQVKIISRLLSGTIITGVGLISYSLYLWHWPIYVFLRWTIGLETTTMHILAIAATFVSASISYIFVERPARRFLATPRFPRLNVIAGVGAIVVLVAIATRVAFGYSQALTLSVTRNQDVWDPGVPLNGLSAGCPKMTVQNQSDQITLTTISAKACPKKVSRTLLVIGDSHAGMYAKMLERLAINDGYTALIFSHTGCNFLDFRTPVAASSPTCANFYHAAIVWLKQTARPNDIVFLPSLRIRRQRNQWGDVIEETAPTDAEKEQAFNDVLEFEAAITESKLSVIFEAPTPMFRSPPFRCSDWFNHNNPVCREGFEVSRSEMELRRASIMDAEKRVTLLVASASIWDPMPTLCSQTDCRAYQNGEPIFFDGDHLSGLGNDMLYESFKYHIEK